MDGAPKGNYDVELVMSQYKSCSVFKRYYVPLMTKLPEELKVRCSGGGGGVLVGAPDFSSDKEQTLKRSAPANLQLNRLIQLKHLEAKN